MTPTCRAILSNIPFISFDRGVDSSVGLKNPHRRLSCDPKLCLIYRRHWIPAHATKSRIMSCNVAPARNAGVCRHCQVPLGCLKTAFVTQGLGSREFVKTMEVSIIFLLPERRKVSCRRYEIHSKANLLCNGYLSPKTWKKLILTYYILSCVCLRWYMPSSPLNIAIAMAPVLSSKVSSCTSTSGVSQDSFRNPGAGKPRQWTWV